MATVIAGVMAILAVLAVLHYRSASAESRPVPIAFVALNSPPETLEVFAGCYEGGVGDVEVLSQGPDSVTVLVLAKGAECREDIAESLPVTLDEPLRERQVIDGYDGRVVENRFP